MDSWTFLTMLHYQTIHSPPTAQLSYTPPWQYHHIIIYVWPFCSGVCKIRGFNQVSSCIPFHIILQSPTVPLSIDYISFFLISSLSIYLFTHIQEELLLCQGTPYPRNISRVEARQRRLVHRNLKNRRIQEKDRQTDRQAEKQSLETFNCCQE